MTAATSSRKTDSTRVAGKLAQWLATWGSHQRRAADEFFPPRIDALTGRPATRPLHTPYQ
jgi:hypothetical protein